jgi:hypothetical protein
MTQKAEQKRVTAAGTHAVVTSAAGGAFQLGIINTFTCIAALQYHCVSMSSTARPASPSITTSQMPPGKKLRLLATHSFRTSGKIFKEQVSSLHLHHWARQLRLRASAAGLPPRSTLAYACDLCPCRCSERVWTKH